MPLRIVPFLSPLSRQQVTPETRSDPATRFDVNLRWATRVYEYLRQCVQDANVRLSLSLGARVWRIFVSRWLRRTARNSARVSQTLPPFLPLWHPSLTSDDVVVFSRSPLSHYIYSGSPVFLDLMAEINKAGLVAHPSPSHLAH